MRRLGRRSARLGKIFLSQFADVRVGVLRCPGGKFLHQCVIEPGIELQEHPVVRFFVVVQNRIDVLFDVLQYPVARQRLDDIPGDVKGRMWASSQVDPLGKQRFPVLDAERKYRAQRQVTFLTAQSLAQDLVLVRGPCEFKEGLRILSMRFDDSLPEIRWTGQNHVHDFFPEYYHGSR